MDTIIRVILFAEPVNFPTFASRFGGRVCEEDTEKKNLKDCSRMSQRLF